MGLLVHGVPGRVQKWRGFGNAIVPQLAAEVIAAFVEAERDWVIRHAADLNAAYADVRWALREALGIPHKAGRGHG